MKGLGRSRAWREHCCSVVDALTKLVSALAEMRKCLCCFAAALLATC